MSLETKSLYLAGFLLVWILGHLRFNTPPRSRSQTTVLLYVTGLTLYLTPVLAIYFALIALVALPGLRNNASWTAIWIAVLLAGVVPRLPLVCRLERWWRGQIHRLSLIPRQGVDLTERLAAASFASTSDLDKELAALLRRRGHDIGSDLFPGAAHLSRRWRKVATLYMRLRKWETIPPYSRFVDRFHFEYRKLSSRFDELSFRVTAVSEATREMDSAQRAPAGQFLSGVSSLETLIDEGAYEIVAEETTEEAPARRVMIESLREDVDRLLLDVCGFIARGVLSVKWSATRRLDALEETMGIRLEPEPHYAVFVYAFVFISSALVLNFAIAGNMLDNENPLSKVAMIATTQVIALLCAVVPKRIYGFANRSLRGRLPYRYFWSVGFGAMVLVLPVVGLYRLYEANWEIGMALRLWEFKWPWLLTSFATAFVSSILIQDGIRKPSDSLKKQQLKDALTLGITLAVTIGVVWFLLHWLRGVVPDSGIAEHLIEVPPPGVTIPMGLIIGAGIGWLFPWSFRTAPIRHAPVKREQLVPGRIEPHSLPG